MQVHKDRPVKLLQNINTKKDQQISIIKKIVVDVCFASLCTFLYVRIKPIFPDIQWFAFLPNNFVQCLKVGTVCILF